MTTATDILKATIIHAAAAALILATCGCGVAVAQSEADGELVEGSLVTTPTAAVFTNTVAWTNITATNVMDISVTDYYRSSPTWECPKHGEQRLAVTIDDAHYCIECVLGGVVKLLKLEPIKEIE